MIGTRPAAPRPLSALLTLLALSTPAPAPARAVSVDSIEVRPLLQRYCYDCHGPDVHKAKINFAEFNDRNAVLRAGLIWSKSRGVLHAHVMPPDDAPQPTDAQRRAIVDWIDRTLEESDRILPRDPGRIVVRRLTRLEYRNTILSLTGVDFHPAAEFPSDDIGYGFDNIGDLLSTSPLLLDKYLRAAEKIADLAIVIPEDRSTRRRLPHAHRLIFGDQTAPKDPREGARIVLRRFATRAFRRPVTQDELDGLLKLYDQAVADHQPYEAAVKIAVEAVLVSPNFLFRIETSPPGAAAPHRVNDWELATRLSYFLWSTMPDPPLFDDAAKNRLHEPEVLEKQVRRMLADPRSIALAENFAVQWLQLRRLEDATPDPKLFPKFNDDLRRAMIQEAVRFFDSVLREDRPITTLIDADYTFLNEKLAELYGVRGVHGTKMRKVTLPDHRRGGVLTMAAVLTSTSNPTRTSPVKRGKWVLETILNAPPPPPAPNAGPLAEINAEQARTLTLRQRVELHRADPHCASCHRRMDPIGFGLENFDAIGAWRQQDAGRPIDSAGVLSDGRPFSGPEQLKKRVLADKDDFAHCLTEKLLTYALGRGIESYDGPTVRAIGRELARHDDRFSTLILAIVRSYPFQYRRPAAAQNQEITR